MPELLHRTEPNYIPPIPGDIAKYLKPDSVFQKLHGKICAWIAWKDGFPVGRIAAIINRSHNQYYHDHVGFFGFFDCEDCTETSRALFAQAEHFLKQEGLTQIRGPYNPSVNEECGLLVDSFEHPPFVAMPWNPPYYEKLVLDADFLSVRKLYAFLLSIGVRLPERVARVAQRISRRAGWKLRPLNLAKLEEELATIHRLYNATLNRNWGFVPIAFEDLLSEAQGLKLIADPEMIIFAEKNGEPVGFAVTLPNINELLIKTKKTPLAGFFRLLHFFWLIKTQRPQQCRLTILGVAPTHRDRGISAWLFSEQLLRAKKRYQMSEISWIDEDNEEIIQNIQMMGGKKYRTYHLYQKKVVD